MRDGALRVLALADHLGHPGGRVHGATTYYLSVYPALRRAGVELTACFMHGLHPVADRLEAAGVSPIFLDRAKWDPRALGDTLKLMEERDSQILHLSGFKAHFLGRVAAAQRGRPALIHLHDTFRLPAAVRAAQRSLARFTSRAIAVSDAVAELGAVEYGLPRAKVETLHNGLELDRFASPGPEEARALRRELGVSETAPLVGIIGRLAPMKGHAYLIEAMPALLESCPEAVVVVCGEGPDEALCRSLVNRLSVSRSIIFAGQRNDIPRVLAALDVVAMPSVFGEGLPYVAIEAIASGTPIVAFPTAGIPDVVPDGRAGLLVPIGDTAALAAALSRVLLDRELRRGLSEGAREHAQAFGLDRHVERLLGLYRAALQPEPLPLSASDTATHELHVAAVFGRGRRRGPTGRRRAGARRSPRRSD